MTAVFCSQIIIYTAAQVSTAVLLLIMICMLLLWVKKHGYNRFNMIKIPVCQPFQMSSLATGLLLLLITLFHMCFCCLCVFVCCRGKSTKFYVKVDADEPSPFKSQFSMRNERLEDDDEPLADPTADSDDTLPSYESWNTIPTMWGVKNWLHTNLYTSCKRHITLITKFIFLFAM